MATTRAALRSGAAYLEALTDGREVYLGGRRVDNVADDPAFRQAARAVARLYDELGSRPEELTAVDEETGERYNAAWLRPRSRDDLARRRAVHELWAESTYGLFGRSPDHVASFLVGMACEPQVAGDSQFAENLVNYW